MNLLALITRLNKLESKAASQTKTIPAAAAGVTVTAAGGGSYAKGAYAEVVAASGVTTNYRPTALVINLISAVDEYEIDIATGTAAAEVVVSTHKFSALAANGNARIELGSIVNVSKNIRLAARIGCNDAVARTIKLSAEYIDNQPA